MFGIKRVNNLKKLLEIIEKRRGEKLSSYECRKYKKGIDYAQGIGLIGTSELGGYHLDSEGQFMLFQIRAEDNARYMTILTILLLGFTIILLIAAGITVINDNSLFQKERDIELNNHINDLKALNYELNMDIGLIASLGNLKPDLLNHSSKIVFSRFITENLRKEISDGRIEDDITRSYLTSTLHQIEEVNNALDAIIYASNYIENETQRINVESQAFYQIENQLISNVTCSKELTSFVIACLTENKTYSKCRSYNSCVFSACGW